MPRRVIQPHERGRKPCLSSEGPLVPYQINLPKSLKAWCIRKGPKWIRNILTKASNKIDDYIITEAEAVQVIKDHNNQVRGDRGLKLLE